MVARDIMTTDVVYVRTTDIARKGAERLLEGTHAALPVLDENDNVVGILSETDILGLAIPEYLSSVADFSFLPNSYAFPPSEGWDIDEVTVGEIMRTAILRTVSPDEPVIEVARIMVREHVRRCPVVEDGKLVGIISRRDLMEIIVRPAIEGTS